MLKSEVEVALDVSKVLFILCSNCKRVPKEYAKDRILLKDKRLCQCFTPLGFDVETMELPEFLDAVGWKGEHEKGMDNVDEYKLTRAIEAWQANRFESLENRMRAAIEAALGKDD